MALFDWGWVRAPSPVALRPTIPESSSPPRSPCFLPRVCFSPRFLCFVSSLVCRSGCREGLNVGMTDVCRLREDGHQVNIGVEVCIRTA